MAMTEFESAQHYYWQIRFEFDKAQALLTQQRHAETLKATQDATAAQLARAQAESQLAVAAQASAAAQRDLIAAMKSEDLARVVEFAVTRISDRTTATGVADIPKSVGEVLAVFAEVKRQTAGG